MVGEGANRPESSILPSRCFKGSFEPKEDFPPSKCLRSRVAPKSKSSQPYQRCRLLREVTAATRKPRRATGRECTRLLIAGLLCHTYYHLNAQGRNSILMARARCDALNFIFSTPLLGRVVGCRKW